MEVLNWWKNACIDWCYARHEDGKFGDQKYLDDWTKRFKGIHELQHLGGGIAPWNLQQYVFKKENDKITGNLIDSDKSFDAVFFHFHGLRFYKNNILRLTDHGYEISPSTFKYFFIPYAKRLIEIEKDIKNKGFNLNVNGAFENSPVPVSRFFAFFHYYKEWMKISKRNYFGKRAIKDITRHYYLHKDSIYKLS
jgi:hypothetical protein